MTDFTEASEVLPLFKAAQDVELDNREHVREAHLFIHVRDGQWEPQFITADDKNPRYTFDLTDPVVNQIAGEIEQASFDVNIKPAGGEATKEDAALLDGMVRNIQNISDAPNLYSTAGRAMITGGIAGWRIEQKFVDGDSFDQDLTITEITDFENRVWFDPSAKKQDKSDSKYVFLINPLSKDEAKEQFPKLDRGIVNVTDPSFIADFGFRADDVFVGQIYFLKAHERELILMSNGSVMEANDDFDKIKDELAAKGITEKKRRTRTVDIVMSRLFDGTGWLTEEAETVFRHWIPIVPIYGNYSIIANKTRYRGVVEKLIDPNRVFNYSMSREVAEGALAPRAKYWMSRKQGEGEGKTLETLNTNHDPVQFYTPDPATGSGGPPVQTGGAQINPGLRMISESMRNIVNQSAGLFSANMGDNPGLQSGIAIKRLQDKGDTGTFGYTKSLEIGICHTGKILVNTMSRVYDTERQVRVLKEDGTFDMVFVNQVVKDKETGDDVTINDLTKGKYDVTCVAGPSFKNRQEETVNSIVELAAIDPAIMQIGNDILLKNTNFPGSDLLAERARAVNFDQGLIPVGQMTDEEKALMEAQLEAQAQQEQGETPEQLIGQAEMIKAQNEQQKTAISVQKDRANIELAARRMQLDTRKMQASAANDQQKTALTADAQKFDQIMAQQAHQLARQEQMMSAVRQMAESLATIQEAAAGPVQGSGLLENVKEQSAIVTEVQSTLARIGNA